MKKRQFKINVPQRVDEFRAGMLTMPAIFCIWAGMKKLDIERIELIKSTRRLLK